MRKVPYYYPEKGKFAARRRWTISLFFLIMIGIPFLVSDGISFFRFDVERMEYHLFFSVYSFTDFHIFLSLTLALTALLIWVTMVWGRIWCGWICPQTILTDFVRWFEKFWMPRQSIRGTERALRMAGTWFTIFLFICLVTLDIIWYFISPYEFSDRLSSGSVSVFLAGSLIVTFLVLFLDIAIVRQSFCEYICPYAKLQSAIFKPTTLIIGFDKSRENDCTQCTMCSRVCPAGIDIRDGLQMACIACGACIDACEPIMTRKGKENLVSYHSRETRQSLLHDNATLFGAGGVVLLLLTGFFVVTHQTVELTVTRNTDMVARQVGEDRVNGYWISADNHGKSPEWIRISVPDQRFSMIPAIDSVLVQAGERIRLPLMIRSRETDSVQTVTIRLQTRLQTTDFNQGFTRE
ncbi:MAG: 4Fe-4S binding protein [Bacteroidetes bacterium]|nr:4Fe-4S binding protein [Bacteroidota bacterium]